MASAVVIILLHLTIRYSILCVLYDTILLHMTLELSQIQSVNKQGTKAVMVLFQSPLPLSDNFRYVGT